LIVIQRFISGYRYIGTVGRRHGKIFGKAKDKTEKARKKEDKDNVTWTKINAYSSVVDRDPNTDPDPAGSETFSCPDPK
jgi:hypothetical protein